MTSGTGFTPPGPPPGSTTTPGQAPPSPWLVPPTPATPQSQGQPYASSPPPGPRTPGYVPVQADRPRTVGADYLPTGSEDLSWTFPGTERVNPAEVFAGPGYTSPRPEQSIWARIAVVAAVFGVVPGVSLLAVVAGHLGLRETAREYVSGRGMALAGLALGYIGVTVWALTGIVWAIAT